MERYDVSEGARLAEMAEAGRLGEDVVITEAGEEVARVTAQPKPPMGERATMTGADLARKLDELRESLPPALFQIDWTNAVRQMRDEKRF